MGTMQPVRIGDYVCGPGRPLLWVTTDGFLVHFGLDSLSELPGIDELRATGLLDLGPAALGESAKEA